MKKNIKLGAIYILVFLVGLLVGGKFLTEKEATFFQGQKYQTVAEVIDGDTFKLDDGQLVRLLSINAPELDSCYADESRDALADLVQSKQIRLEKDLTHKDKFDRLLRYVVLPSPESDGDDILVNDYLVRQGLSFAEPYPPDVRYRKLLYEAEGVARENSRGLWDTCDYETKLESEQELDTPPPSDDCIIKGNISRKGFGNVYMLPGCPNYTSTKIDPRKGDRYFCSIEEAEAAGFHKSLNCLE